MYGPEPGAPLVALTALVSVTTALLVTVVVSVLVSVLVPSNTLVVVTVMALVCPAVAVPGKVPTTMNLNAALAARGPVDVIAGPVGWPLPLSAKIWTPVMLNAPVLVVVRLKLSLPLPVFVSVCG